MNYLDPDNTEELLDELKTLANVGEIFIFVAKLFPTWVVGFSNTYSKDYPHLQSNWETVCKKIGTTQTQILIVDDIVFDENHSIINMVSELLTRSGYSVRRAVEFLLCETCGSAVPTEDLHKKMKEHKVSVPLCWSKSCSEC